MLSSFNNQIQIINLSTGEEVKRFTGHKHTSHLIDLCFYCKDDNDDYFVVSGSEDGAIYSWNIEEKNAHQKFLHKRTEEKDENISMEQQSENTKAQVSSSSISSHLIKQSAYHENVINTLTLNNEGLVAYSNFPDKTNSLYFLNNCNMNIDS